MTAFLKRSDGGWVLAAAAVAGAVLVALWGPQRAQGAGLLIADGGLGGVLEIEEHTVRVTINNGIAVTHVDQVFRNTEDRQVEALYTFPVPRSASVSNFSMWINGKEMVGEVVEKKRAREIYESYKQVRRDPGLLEQTDYRTFEMRIFPIGPKAQQHVQITYYQELDFDHDWATYVYPLAQMSRKDVRSTSAGKLSFALEARSAVPITEMESPSHAKDFAVARHGDSYAQASLEVTGGDLNRDVVVAYHLSRPHTGIDLIASKAPDEDGYFYMTLTAGEELAGLSKGMDYVFILDVSGSMADGGKLRISRESIVAFINALSPEDRFEVITFNVQPARLFDALTAVSDESKARAAEFLDTQQARGGTVLRPALTLAYRYADPDRPLNAVVLSDGMTEQSERRELLQLITERPGNTRVFCVGVGNDVNRPLLEQLASDAGGLAAFISQGDNFERQAQAFRRKLLRPVATNLKIDFEGTAVRDVEPLELPNLYHGSPVRLYGRYKGSGPVTVNVEADVAGMPLKKSVQIEFPAADNSNPEIERMWAWHRIDRLMPQAGGPGDVATTEIIRLGEAYSIVSEYTSFIVLENDGEYKRWKIDRRNALRIRNERASQERLRKELEEIRAKALSQLGPAAPASQVKLAGASTDPSAPGAAGDPGGTQMVDATRSPAARPGWNIDFTPRSNRSSGGGGGRSGGGAIDPLSGAIALSLAGFALLTGRRRSGRHSAAPRDEQ